MRKLAFLVAAASLFAFAPIVSRFGPVASSVALVWLGVLVAVCASGTAQSIAVATGAVGAFAGGMLAPISPAAAGAVLVAAAFAERTTRIRSRTARAVHVGVALVGGALAGSLSVAYAATSVPVTAVAVVVAAVLAALPLLVEADDPVAHALDQAAALVADPARSSLLQGADLRRTVTEIPLDRETQSRVKKTWKALLDLAEARVRLERSRPRLMLRVADLPPTSTSTPTSAAAPSLDAPSTPTPTAAPSAADAVLVMVDQRIAEHVAVLSKAFVAVDTARAAALGLDDSALRNIDTLGDSLEEASRAMVEVKGEAAG